MATLQIRCVKTSTNEHKIFAPMGLVFNGLCAQLADLLDQIDIIASAGVGYFATLWNY